MVIKRRRRILQSINLIERNYYDKKYNEDIENISNLSDDSKSPSLHLSLSNLSSPTGSLKDNKVFYFNILLKYYNFLKLIFLYLFINLIEWQY